MVANQFNAKTDTNSSFLNYFRLDLMKILATSDIHQMISKWHDLVHVCQNEKFDVVVIAGDLFPKDHYITGQLFFMKPLKKYAKKIKDTGAEIILLLGNDDNQLLIEEMEKGEQEGLWHYVAEKVVKVKGYEFAGMPYVPDYPFGYKYWCAGDFAEGRHIALKQRSEPLLIDDDNKYIVIPDYAKYLTDKKKIWESLVETASKVEDIKKSIWLIHAPPASMMLDVCASGERVGSMAVLKFIEEYQPLLTIHGHIHESPEYNGYRWHNQEGQTTCIQGGQLGFELYYSTLVLDDDKIITKTHSIY